MDRYKLKRLLGRLIDKDDPTLENLPNGEYVYWHPDNPKAVLDGEFSADELEAIAIWMRAHSHD